MLNINGVQYRAMPNAPHRDVLELLNHHHHFSMIGVEYTTRYGHGRFQQDTKSWTELIASTITQIRGYDGNVPPGVTQPLLFFVLPFLELPLIR